MNSPFVHLRCFIQDLSTSRNGEGDSEQIREGAPVEKTDREVCLLFTEISVLIEDDIQILVTHLRRSIPNRIP